MMTKKKLIKLGFVQYYDVFTRKYTWALGEHATEFAGEPITLPILIYDIETQTCSCRDVKLECTTTISISKFVESVNFLFDLSLNINKRKVTELVDKLSPLELHTLFYKVRKKLNKLPFVYNDKSRLTYTNYFASCKIWHYDARTEIESLNEKYGKQPHK